jgi:septal ring factor EnvC (AmiA/AmiB activator)
VRNTRFISSLLAALLIHSWGVEAAQPSSQAPKESLQDIQSRIQDLKQELDRTQDAHADASDALKASEQAISESNRKLMELAQQEKSSAASLNDIRKEKSGLETTIASQQKLLGELFYRQYINGEQSYLRALLQQRDPNQMARDVVYLGYVSRARANLIGDLRHNLTHVAQLDAQTQSSLQKIAELKSAQEKERLELQKQQAERRQLLQRLSAQIKSQRGEISKLQRDEKRLTQLIERLSRIVTKPAKKAPSKPQSASPTAPQSAPQRNEELPSPFSGNGTFAGTRGKLRLPVRGDILNRFGSPREETGVSWKGLFIKSPEGVEVRSIANGRVVFADWLRGFGNLIIVDHGDGYMSLYGNNQTLLKKAGEEVTAGDAIAAVGNSGGIPQAGLYFEMRYQSRPFDPLSWCAVR